jgi:hypothetical protein
MTATAYTCPACDAPIYVSNGVYWCDSCGDYFYPEDATMEPPTHDAGASEVPTVPDPGTPEFGALLSETIKTALASQLRLNDLLALQFPDLGAEDTAYIAADGTVYVIETDGEGVYVISPVEKGAVI